MNKQKLSLAIIANDSKSQIINNQLNQITGGGDPPPFGKDRMAKGDPPPFGKDRMAKGDPPPFGRD